MRVLLDLCRLLGWRMAAEHGAGRDRGRRAGEEDAGGSQLSEESRSQAAMRGCHVGLSQGGHSECRALSFSF
jgi:hypothetical protein